MSRRYKKGQKEQSNNYLKTKKNHLKVTRKLTNMSQNFHEFVRQLKYKAESQGTIFHKASKLFASSKLCSCCGYKYNKKDYNDIEWSLEIRTWECFRCKTKHDRDLNASYNLRNLYA